MQMMVLDRFKYHIVPHIAEKGTTQEMWDVIVKLYQDPSENKKMILKERLSTIKMHKGADITSLSHHVSTCQG